MDFHLVFLLAFYLLQNLCLTLNITRDCSKHDLRTEPANVTTELGTNISIEWEMNDTTKWKDVFKLHFKTLETDFNIEIGLDEPSASAYFLFDDLDNSTIDYFSLPVRLSFRNGKMVSSLIRDPLVLDPYVPQNESFELDLDLGTLFFNCRQRCFKRDSVFRETFTVSSNKTFYLKSKDENYTEEFFLSFCSYDNTSGVNVWILPSSQDVDALCSDLRGNIPVFNLTSSSWTELTTFYVRTVFFIKIILVKVNGELYQVGVPETPVIHIEVPEGQAYWVTDCKPEDVEIPDEEMKLLYASKGLYTLNSQGNKTVLDPPKDSYILGVDFDWDSNCNFWGLDNTQGINKICQGRSYKLLKNNDFETMAVDWITKNIYFVASKEDEKEIFVSDAFGHHIKQVFEANLTMSPRGLALNPPHGYLYWTDWSYESPHIGKTGMDGSFPRKIIETGLRWPNAIVYDFETQEIYWNDAGLDYISKADANGENIQIIWDSSKDQRGAFHMFGMTIYDKVLYSTDWYRSAILSLNLTSPGSVATVQEGLNRPMGIKAVHPSRQPKMPVNPCDEKECQALCLLAPGKRGICACPNGAILAQDHTSCSLA